MPLETSEPLRTLLETTDPAQQERAWERFVGDHSRLMLHVIRQQAATHDEVMNRYAFVLDRLRADDFRRLRSWGGRNDCRLTTWLVVVVRRLCTDYARRHYGRSRTAGAPALEERRQRRRLADFVVDELKPDVVDSSDWPDAEASVRRAELRATLARCVAELPAADRLLLTLRFQDELSAARIARVLSLPTPFHVYRRLNHLLERLRTALRRHGVEDSVP